MFGVWESWLRRRRSVNLLWWGRRRPPSANVGGHLKREGKGEDWDTVQQLAADDLGSRVTCSETSG